MFIFTSLSLGRFWWPKNHTNGARTTTLKIRMGQKKVECFISAMRKACFQNDERINLKIKNLFHDIILSVLRSKIRSWGLVNARGKISLILIGSLSNTRLGSKNVFPLDMPRRFCSDSRSDSRSTRKPEWAQQSCECECLTDRPPLLRSLF